MKTSFFFFLAPLVLPFHARADGPAPATYGCRLLLVAGDLGGESPEWSFVSNTSGTHGGDPQVFRKGGHEISVTVDKQWLSLSWLRDGKKVAEAEFVVGQGDQPQFKVGILADPGHDGDQASVSCQRR